MFLNQSRTKIMFSLEWFYVFFICLCLTQPIVESFNNYSICDRMVENNISCKLRNAYERELIIEFPLQKPKITMRALSSQYINGSKVEVNCKDKSKFLSIFEFLPSIKIENDKFRIEKVTWKKCEPPNESFLNIANKLINRTTDTITSLKIENVNSFLSLAHFQSTKTLFVELSTVNLNNNAFDEFIILQRLHISDCVQTVSSSIFSNQKRIKFLTLKRCNFDNMNFEGLSGVENYVMTYVSFTNSSNEGFRKMRSLTDLKLFAVPISFTSNMFQSNKQLTFVKIEKSTSFIPSELFTNLPKLQSVALSQNHIKNLPDDLFINSTRIAELDFSSNELETIPPLLLTGLPQLNRLLLSKNRLKSLSFLPEIINTKPYQNSQKFVAIFANSNNLTELVVEDMWMSEIPLIYIEVKWNNIRKVTLPKDINYFTSHIATQMILNYDNNPIECDCQNYEFLNFLQNKTNEDYERISTIKTSMDCAGNTTETVESYDLLKITCDYDGSCPDRCKCFTIPHNNTVVVDCSGKNFDQIPYYESYGNFKLKINNNNLKSLSISDATLETIIDASDNKIESVYFAVTPTNLKKLNLNKNRLKFVTNKTLEILKKSKTSLTLNGNPWPCDCTTVELFSFIISNPANILDYDELLCENGELFKNLSADALCPGYEVEIAVIAIFVAVLGALIAVYYKYQAIIKMWLYVNNYCEFFISDAEFEKDKRYDAFVMYSWEDGDYVADKLVAELEEKEGYKLCCHERDWPGGPLIVDLVKLLTLKVLKRFQFFKI